MSSLWMVIMGLWCSALLVLTGCDSTGVSAAGGGGTQADVYKAAPKTVDANNPPSLRVSNLIGGGITIMTGSNNEIAPDVIATGVSRTLQSALEEADSHINLINTGAEVRVEATAGANPKDSAQLHVRVPPGTALAAVTIPKGDVVVYGRMGDVTANISGTGDINLLGANGDINLKTGKGAITAELAPESNNRNNNVTARASQGDIDIIAVDAKVSAITTEKDVRFIGTLRDGETHVFSTTAGGNVTIAVPVTPTGSAQAYRVYASTSRSPIITNFPANQRTGPNALAICGVIHSPGPYHYDVANTSAHFGRLEVSPAPTSTVFFTGTLTASFYRFDTNQPQISLFAPRSQAIHIYTAADLAQIAAGKVPVDDDCKGALTDNLDQLPAVVLNLRSGSGRIFIHHIDLQ